MNKLVAKPESTDETSIRDVSPGANADYDSWARAKIEAALREADEHPDWLIPQAEVWKKFGLER